MGEIFFFRIWGNKKSLCEDERDEEGSHGSCFCCLCESHIMKSAAESLFKMHHLQNDTNSQVGKKKAPGLQLLRKDSFPHSSSGYECVESKEGYRSKTEPFFTFFKNFAAQMAGGFDEKAGGGGAQMGVMQGPMVSKSRDIFFHLLIIYLLYFIHISISWRNRKDFFFFHLGNLK